MKIDNLKFDKLKSNEIIEKIINFIGDNRNIIIKYLLIFIISILVILIGVFSYKSYSSYKTINDKIAYMEKIDDNGLINFIKNNNLRSIDSVANTANFVYKTKKYTTGYVLQIVLTNLVKNPTKKRIINSLLLKNIKGDISLSKIILNLSNKKKLIELVGDEKDYLNIIENITYIKDSNIVREYISSFPKIKADKYLSSILKTLYIYELVFIEANLQAEYNIYNNKLKQYQAPYNNFLKYVFFPEINIWENKYSNKINVDLFGADYLNKAKYIDINLISYWSDFFKYAYKGKNYKGKTNEIKDISIGKMKLEKIKGVNNIATLPIKLNFMLKSESSFYGLISKLTLTSNIKNIMLISEFTYDLWNNIKAHINKNLLKGNNNKKPIGYIYMENVLDNCANNENVKCADLFNCEGCSDYKLKKILRNSNYKGSLTGAYEFITNEFKDINSYKDSTFYKYFQNDYYKINDIDKLIGARLSDCIKGGYCNDILTDKYKGDIIANTIEVFAEYCKKGALTKCIRNPNNDDCKTCRYAFVRKFDTNYFIAYTLVNDIDKIRKYGFIDRLKDVYNNIPGILELGQFKFVNIDDPVYSYKAGVDLKVYYRFISTEELGKILSYIGKKRCSNVTDGKAWSLPLAYNYVNGEINNIKNIDLGADKVYNLEILKDLINKMKKEYPKANNIQKLLYSLQVYRIFSERGYCKR